MAFVDGGSSCKKRKFAPGDSPSTAGPTVVHGTWTPTLSDGTNLATLSTALGSYTRIGDLVLAEVSVLCTSIGSASGQVRVSMPFARYHDPGVTALSSCGPIGYMTFGATGTMQDLLALRMDTDLNYAFLLRSEENSAGASLTFAQIMSNGNTTVRASIVYRAAA